MLKELEIKDFALVEHVNVPFAAGFNVLTGETGAGKSIIMDALNVVLGGRAGASLIRPDGDKACIEATFAASPEVSAWLKEKELLSEDESEHFTISREISKSGSKLRINGTLVNAGLVSELSSKLITVHAQHESRTLLSGQSQLEMLDALGDDEQKKLLAKVRTLYAKKRELAAQLEDLSAKEADRERRLEFARYQLSELEAAQLSDPNEDETIAAEKKISSSVADLKTLVATVQQFLKGGEGDFQHGASELLDRAADELASAAQIDSALEPARVVLSECVTRIEEESRALRKYCDGLDCDPEKLAYLEERHAQLATIKRKYGPTLADALERVDSLSSEIAELDNSTAKIISIKDELAAVEHDLGAAAVQLSKKRKTLAKKISERIEKELFDLGMEKCRFEIALNMDGENIGPTGGDKAEFMIAPNPGQPACPVSKIASGGELSRVMLAVKSIFAGADHVATVIFDEIDTGLSGRVLQSMRDKLAKLAHSHQILCITHQPIIAAVADNHVFVRKEHKANATFTSAKVLTDEERVDALASMAGGHSNQDASAAFAKALFDESARLRASM